MGKGGTITPGPPGHRSLHFEIIQKTLADGNATIKAADLELINEIKHVFPIVELSGASSSSMLGYAYAVGVRIAGDSSAGVYYYKGTTASISVLVAGY